MKNVSIMGAAILAAVAVSQPLYARDFGLPQINSQKQNGAGGGATSAVNKPNLGGLSGLGVPSGTKGGGVGAGIIKNSGIKTSVVPSGVSGSAQGQVSGIQDQRGGAVGVQRADGVSARQTTNLQTGATKAKESAGGAAAGVQKGATVSPGETSTVQIGAAKAKEAAGGAAAGVQPNDQGVKLSNTQLNAIKNSRVNPVVNPAVNQDDPDKMETPAQIKNWFTKLLADKTPKPMIMPPAHIEGHVPKPPKPQAE